MRMDRISPPLLLIWMLVSLAPALAGQQTFSSTTTGTMPKAVPAATSTYLLGIYPQYYYPCYRRFRGGEPTVQSLHYRCCPYGPLAPDTLPGQCPNNQANLLNPQLYQRFLVPTRPPALRRPLPPAPHRVPSFDRAPNPPNQSFNPGFGRIAAPPQAARIAPPRRVPPAA